MSTNLVGTAGINCILSRINTLASTWEELAPGLVLAGMTHEDFKSITAPTRTIRQESFELQARIRANVSKKQKADRVSRKAANQIIAAIKADTNLGPDCPLYRAMGFIPESERKSPRKKEQAIG